MCPHVSLRSMTVSVVRSGDPQGLLEQMLPSRTETRRMSVAEARKILVQQETDKLVDKETLYRTALRRAEAVAPFHR